VLELAQAAVFCLRVLKKGFNAGECWWIPLVIAHADCLLLEHAQGNLDAGESSFPLKIEHAQAIVYCLSTLEGNLKRDD
jgi:hypothetical protein